jgi:hypothetical protein
VLTELRIRFAAKRAAAPPRAGICAAAGVLLALSSALLVSIAAFPPPALGYANRVYESQLKRELVVPGAIAIDSANNVWVTDTFNSRKAVVKYNYSNEQLPQFLGGGVFGCAGSRLYSAGVDWLTDDLYLGDACTNLVDVFDSAGSPIAELGPYGEGQISVAVDNSSGPSAGRVYTSQTEGPAVHAFDAGGLPAPFTASAGYIEENTLTGTPNGPFGSAGYQILLSLAVDGSGNLFVSDQVNNVVDEFEASGLFVRQIAGTPAGPFGEVEAVAADPTNGDILVVDRKEQVIDEFNGAGAYVAQIDGSETPAGLFSELGALAVSASGRLYVADSGHSAVDIYSPGTLLPDIVYGGVSDGSADQTSASLNATIDPNGGGAVTTCQFEYVERSLYEPSAVNPFAAGQSAPCLPSGPYAAKTAVTASMSGLTPGAEYRYRLVVANSNGRKDGRVRSFILGPPTVVATSARELTATTATLVTDVNPGGADTHIRFEYGPTTDYGSSVPVPDEDIGSEGIDQTHLVPVSSLEPQVTYHYRLRASNVFGEDLSADHTFSFYPPSCPNHLLREITNSSHLPDCRAYELVSPADAGGTSLFPEGPSSPTAVDPARFAFGGFLGVVPGAGNPPNRLGDLYVATRTSTGWVTKYVGIPANEAVEVNGPPNEPYGDGGALLTSPSGVRATPALDRFADWDDGDIGFSGLSHGSVVPHLWNAEGESLGVWPTVPGFSAGALFNQSPDFSHYYFESEEAIYDNDTAAGTASLISLASDATPITIAGIPGSSGDGSHVLMSTARCTGRAANSCNPGVLYMRVDDGITYDVSKGNVVRYVGMTDSASKVYFTSEAQLTSDDHDASTDLYVWDETSDSVTLASLGTGGTGNSDECTTIWTTLCGVVPYRNRASFVRPNRLGGIEGNGLSDNAIAAVNGDIYFYSPEQLDGNRGVLNGQNLYDFRDGRPQYVTTFDTGPFCTRGSECTEGPMARIQVSPSDGHMAFLSASNVTGYDSEGLLEMYTYDPATGALVCMSCRTDGPAVSNTEASSNGRFMTDDGRAFFSTSDPLVPEDVNGLRDVYEYQDNQPQLISSGTGTKDSGIVGGGRPVNRGLFKAGLVGVSANGADAFFSTYDALVGQDQNGSQLRFYDARTGGGFGMAAPPQPCESGAECRGPRSEPPLSPEAASGSDLGTGGNVLRRRRRRHHRHHRVRHRDHAAGSTHGRR